jgi:hypothetical protein
MQLVVRDPNLPTIEPKGGTHNLSFYMGDWSHASKMEIIPDVMLLTTSSNLHKSAWYNSIYTLATQKMGPLDIVYRNVLVKSQKENLARTSLDIGDLRLGAGGDCTIETTGTENLPIQSGKEAIKISFPTRFVHDIVSTENWTTFKILVKDLTDFNIRNYTREMCKIFVNKWNLDYS